MNRYLKSIAAVAAVVLVAIAATTLLGGRLGSRDRNGPTQSASRLADDSTEASPGAELQIAEALSAGAHSTTVFKPGFSFTVPDGWSIEETATHARIYGDLETPSIHVVDKVALLADLEETEGGRHGRFGINPLACPSWDFGTRMEAATIVDELRASPALWASEPRPVHLGSLEGLMLDVSVNPSWTGRCRPTTGAGRLVRVAVPLMLGPGGDTFGVTDSERGRLILLNRATDPPRVLMVFITNRSDFDTFFDQAMPVVGSFEFDATS